MLSEPWLLAALVISIWSSPTASALIGLPMQAPRHIAIENRAYISKPLDFRTTTPNIPGSLSTTIEATTSTWTVDVTSLSNALGSFPTYTSPMTTLTTQTAPTTTQVLYTGQAILTGACAIPASSVLHFAGSGSFSIEVALVGCSDEHPECCPVPVLTPSITKTTGPTSVAKHFTRVDDRAADVTGVVFALNASPLAVCPSDYTRLSGVCCPSGYSLYDRALYSHVVPCYSSLAVQITGQPHFLTTASFSEAASTSFSEATSTSFSEATSTLFSEATSTSFSEATSMYLPATETSTTEGQRETSEPIVPPHGDGPEILPNGRRSNENVPMNVDHIFAIGLPHTGSSHHGLDSGTKAAIVVSVSIGFAAVVAAAALFCFWRQRSNAENCGSDIVDKGMSPQGNPPEYTSPTVELVDCSGRSRLASEWKNAEAGWPTNESAVSLGITGKPASVYSVT